MPLRRNLKKIRCSRLFANPITFARRCRVTSKLSRLHRFLVRQSIALSLDDVS